MAHTYSRLYGLQTMELRFFSVHGPWGRTDMAPILLAKVILSSQPIKIFSQGQIQRDFTYIEDNVAWSICYFAFSSCLRRN